MKHLLLIKLRSLGDVILGARAFAAIRKAHPKALISLLVQPPAHEILKFSGWADEVFAYSKSAMDRQGFFARARKEARLADALKSRKFDLAADFYGSRRSALLSKASGASMKWGLDLPETKGFYDLRINAEDRLVCSAVELDRRVAAVLGAPDCPEVLWPVPPSALEAADLFLEKNKLTSGKNLVAVNPFASCPTKEWYPEKWANLLDGIDRLGLKVFFTCAPLEAWRMAALLGKIRRPLPVYAEGALTPLMGLYRRARAVGSVDSGPRHLAAAVGTPTVTVWGPERPSRWHPYDLKKHPLAVREVPCRPCGLSVCVEKKHECLAMLEPSAVLTALKTLLG
jgi:ADP-heptose:LPS heptosyltransferase